MIQIDIYPKRKEFEFLLDKYPPTLANKQLPDWYKKTKNLDKFKLLDRSKNNLHIKRCPAVKEEITNGIILRAWSDIYFYKKENENYIYWEMEIGKVIQNFEWISSHNHQQVDNLDLNEINNFGVFKLNSPFYFKTTKGYGLEFKDVFYHHRRNIRLLPGMVENDIWHETNFPFEFYFDVNNEKPFKFMIKAGDPLLMIKPFKLKEKYKLKLNKYNSKFDEHQQNNQRFLLSLSENWNRYKNNL